MISDSENTLLDAIQNRAELAMEDVARQTNGFSGCYCLIPNFTLGYFQALQLSMPAFSYQKKREAVKFKGLNTVDQEEHQVNSSQKAAICSQRPLIYDKVRLRRGWQTLMWHHCHQKPREWFYISGRQFLVRMYMFMCMCTYM